MIKDLRKFTARLPIKAAKDVAKAYKRDQVIIVAWEAKRRLLNVVSYGRTLKDCEQAAARDIGEMARRVRCAPAKQCDACVYWYGWGSD